MRWFLLTLCAAMVGSFTVTLFAERRRNRTVIAVVNEGNQPGWLAGTRVRSIDGRCGVVIPNHATDEHYMYAHPIVDWGDGTRTRVNADTLTRHPDDWFTRATNNTENM